MLTFFGVIINFDNVRNRKFFGKHSICETIMHEHENAKKFIQIKHH